MKKTITTIMLLGGAVAGYSQGQIYFTTYQGGTFTQRIFAYSASDAAINTSVTYGNYTVTEQVGSTASGVLVKEKPAGTTVYNGAPLSGTGYDLELLAGVGSGLSLSALTPVAGTIDTFSTGPTSLGLSQPPAAAPVLTSVANGPVTVAIAAWNTEGGTLTTLLAAQQYEKANPTAQVWGISPVSSFSSTGGANQVLIPYLSAGSNPNMSFALGAVATPEPSTIALGVMGASALLFRRRK